MVGITLMAKFVQPGSKTFNTYIDYIDREIAARNYTYTNYSDFNDYLDDVEKSEIICSDQLTKQEKEFHKLNRPETTTELFTADSDQLTISEKDALKEAFSTAQDNGSLMWQTVISFDNRWLEKNGLLDSNTKNLNVKKLQEFTRASMSEMLGKECLNDALWSAAIHYNTDNLHIHIATVEIIPTRERGKFKEKTIKSAKSTFANKVLEQSLDNQKVNEIIRDRIVQGLRQAPLNQNNEIMSAFYQLYQSLPEDHRLWNYKNQTNNKDIHAQIDNISTLFINKYHLEDYMEFSTLLDKHQELYTEAYGQRKQQDKSHKQKNIDDLYYRMGNSILKQCREYYRLEQSEKYAKKSEQISKQVSKRNKASENLKKYYQKVSILNQLKKALKNDLQTSKNQAAYSRLQEEIEMERN